MVNSTRLPADLKPSKLTRMGLLVINLYVSVFSLFFLFSVLLFTSLGCSTMRLMQGVNLRTFRKSGAVLFLCSGFLGL